MLTCRIRSKSVALKRALFDDELMDVYQEEIGSVRDEVRAARADQVDVMAHAAEHAVSSLAEVSDEA